jgi:hypothetical protein
MKGQEQCHSEGVDNRGHTHGCSSHKEIGVEQCAIECRENRTEQNAM